MGKIWQITLNEICLIASNISQIDKKISHKYSFALLLNYSFATKTTTSRIMIILLLYTNNEYYYCYYYYFIFYTLLLILLAIFKILFLCFEVKRYFENKKINLKIFYFKNLKKKKKKRVRRYSQNPFSF